MRSPRGVTGWQPYEMIEEIVTTAQRCPTLHHWWVAQLAKFYFQEAYDWPRGWPRVGPKIGFASRLSAGALCKRAHLATSDKPKVVRHVAAIVGEP